MPNTVSLAKFCAAHALPWSTSIEEKVELYVELLLTYNKTMNLIGPMDGEGIKVNLFIDSLVAAIAREPKGTLLDVGSGAGLPGIVLGIFYPEIEITLIEPRRKRADFLELALRKLDFENAYVHQKRIETSPHALYDYVISKAFRKPVEWLPLASKWLRDDGAVLCMHTTDADLEVSELVLRKTITHQALDLEISSRPRAVSVFAKP